VLSEGCGVVVEPGEAAELAERLLDLSRDPEAVAAMGIKSRRLYEQRFGLQPSLDHYERLILDVVARQPRLAREQP
jgi:glycosyltransferase involved in cell wall biosynthesis